MFLCERRGEAAAGDKRGKLVPADHARDVPGPAIARTQMRVHRVDEQARPGDGEGCGVPHVLLPRVRRRQPNRGARHEATGHVAPRQSDVQSLF